MKLAYITELRGDRWYTELGEGPVVLVSAECEAHHLLARAFHRADGERRLGGDLSENLHDAWSALLDIILLPAVKWIDEGIAVRVNVDNEC